MLPAEGTDSIDDAIHVPEGNAVHMAVEVIKDCFDFLRVHAVILIVAGIEHFQNGLCVSITIVWWMLRNISFQNFKILFQGNTSSKFCVMLPYRKEKYNCRICQSCAVPVGSFALPGGAFCYVVRPAPDV